MKGVHRPLGIPYNTKLLLQGSLARMDCDVLDRFAGPSQRIAEPKDKMLEQVPVNLIKG